VVAAVKVRLKDPKAVLKAAAKVPVVPKAAANTDKVPAAKDLKAAAIKPSTSMRKGGNTPIAPFFLYRL
jgi:hypothetical protein